MSMLSKIITFAFVQNVLSLEQNPPKWNSEKVKIFSPEQQDSQEILDEIFKEQGGHEPACHGEFSEGRYALLFKKGIYDLNVNVGFYTTVHGLGRHPSDTVLNNLICENGSFKFDVGALDNFWRGAENVKVVPQNGKMIWAASQACPLRRIIVDGNLDLFQYNYPEPAAGYASGGYMSEMTVTGNITSGTQQQFFSRNSYMGNWQESGAWNMVFVGNQNSPQSHCGNSDGKLASTAVESTPIIVEKPYIIQDNDRFSLMVPNLEKNKIGPTINYENAIEIPFENVYVANESDSAETINKKLEENFMHLVLQPGQYHLEQPIKIINPNTVVLGLGLATLISSNGQPCIEVSNVQGVRISGVLLQAGPIKSESLLKWGQGNYEGNPENPGAIHDVFARVGGPDEYEVMTDFMIQINSDNVIIDNVWLWRADHSKTGLIKNSQNPVKTALQVNGNNVTGYGVACEHTLENLLEWNGENGKTYFYQSELPYDVDNSYGERGYASYKVNQNVKSHESWGAGVYSYFRDNQVSVNSAILAPENSNVKFHNSLTVFLNGNGEINHVINQQGEKVSNSSHISYNCEFDSSIDFTKIQDLYFKNLTDLQIIQ